MVVLLVAMAVGAIWMSALLPAWRQQVQRQREEELIFIGEQ
jgi:type II secretory pathway pseudopilin PulG